MSEGVKGKDAFQIECLEPFLIPPLLILPFTSNASNNFCKR
jgi:hypothetical protein